MTSAIQIEAVSRRFRRRTALRSVTATIPIAGHPAYITTSAATPTGKVYVVCKDSQVMTVIKTNTDTVDTTIPLQGYGVSVRMTQP